MSEGAWDAVMANIVNTDGTTMIPGGSGFKTTTYPDAKYYDKYSYNTEMYNYIGGKLGDATKEVYKGSYGWYSDNAVFPTKWFYRGQLKSNHSYAGVFAYGNNTSSTSSSISSRLIITP